MAIDKTQPVAINPEGRSGHNTSGADIPKGTIVKYKATGDREILAAAAATDTLLGVAGEDIADGNWGRVVIRGVAQVLAGGALTRYGKVTSNAAGKAADAVATNSVLGIVRDVGALDELVEVELVGPGAEVL